MKITQKIWCGDYETEQLVERRLTNIGCCWLLGSPDLSRKTNLALYLLPMTSGRVRLAYTNGFRLTFEEIDAIELHYNDLTESLVKEKAGDTVGF